MAGDVDSLADAAMRAVDASRDAVTTLLVNARVTVVNINCAELGGAGVETASVNA